MSSDSVIRVDNLSKCYQIYSRPVHRLMQMLFRGRRIFFREFWALRDISFDICRGETVGVIGKNGSGKSTLLQILCGTLSLTGGNVEVNGRVAALLELGSGFNPEFTGRDNVYLSASLYGLDQDQITRRFDKIAAFADIGDFIDQPVKSYSSGMYVRLAFAVIAHVDADILIIDEALAVGDVFFVQKCMRFLRKFSESGTLFFVSHDTHAVVNLCSKAILLENGMIKKMGTPKDVSEQYLAMLQDENSSTRHIENPNSAKVASADDAVTDADANLINVQKGSQNDFGTGHSRILAVGLTDESGNTPVTVVGGEMLCLTVRCCAHETIENPLVGFVVKDRLGQVIFGGNTASEQGGKMPNEISKDTIFDTGFVFRMPMLQSADYTISLAVGQGIQENHFHHHWVHDALVVNCRPEGVCIGMLDVQINDVVFKSLDS